MKVYIDANTLICATEKRDDVSMRLRRILRAGVSAHAVIMTSALTMAETLVKPLRLFSAGSGNPDALRLITIYSSMIESHTAIDSIPIGSDILFNAAKLRADHGKLKLPDAIHLASAKWREADLFVTDDRDLLSVARSHLAACSFDLSELDAVLENLEPRGDESR